ncbi:unnamed protein product, partial [Rotaria sp. Silwood2]
KITNVSRLSFQVNACQKVIDLICAYNYNKGSHVIINIIVKYFCNAIRNNLTAFRGRFRKMVYKPFTFYRGSVLLLYQDLERDKDPWDDLHAENIDLYLDSHEILNFTKRRGILSKVF